MYAKKAEIVYNNIGLEVYQLPDGSYHLSKTQVAKAIEKYDSSVQEFLQGKSPEALPYKGFSFREIGIEGLNTTFHSVPLTIAAAYWTYWAQKGNTKAAALVATSVTEYKEKVETYPEFADLLDVAKSEIGQHEYLQGVTCKQFILLNNIPLNEDAWCTLPRRTASFYSSTKGFDPKRRGSHNVYYNQDVAYIVATLRLIMKGL
jgi:hypothetical protein